MRRSGRTLLLLRLAALVIGSVAGLRPVGTRVCKRPRTAERSRGAWAPPLVRSKVLPPPGMDGGHGPRQRLQTQFGAISRAQWLGRSRKGRPLPYALSRDERSTVGGWG